MPNQRPKIVGMDDAYRRIRIRCYGADGDSFSFAVPGWGSNRVMLVKKADIPPEVAATIKNGGSVIVEATNECADYAKCKFRNWEIDK